MTLYGLAMTLGLLLRVLEANCKAASFGKDTEAEVQMRASVSAGNCLEEPVTISLPNEGDYASFTSPNYPNDYPAFIKCGWRFTTSSASRLQLSCKQVKMSWLAVLYVTDDGKTTREGCLICVGKTFDYTSQSNEVTVGLSNSFLFRGQGFECIITAVEKPPCTCGVPAADRIVGGETAGENRYPWMAILTNSGSLICGGSVIGDQFVLTSAHCTEGLLAEDIRVKLGYYKTDAKPWGRITATVLEIINHPSFSSVLDGNDVALVRIAPIDFDAYPNIRAVCLPSGTSTYAGVNATATGWGRTESGYLSTTLLKVNVPTITNSACDSAYSVYTTITDTMICAGSTGLDTCQGDSGGPLMVANSGGYDEIIGVTSWGKGCGREGYPGVYARVTALRAWILSETSSSTICTPPA